MFVGFLQKKLNLSTLSAMLCLKYFMNAFSNQFFGSNFISRLMFSAMIWIYLLIIVYLLELSHQFHALILDQICRNIPIYTALEMKML